ncbi:C39 family peptidase [Uliginosibacterium sp. sgz301328]|uniref:C39 family peptidase n=1 Tax=Uliginosibacterium sp. sgz301328 TaxID=3243764 RepID=UPI00359D53D7
MRYAVILILCALGAVPPAWGGDVVVEVAGGSYSLHLTSIKEMRFASTMRQQYDFSCGSAAVATLLTYQYGSPVTEAAVFTRMFAQGNRAKIQREGFSMLDMKRYLDASGFGSDGLEITLDQLASAKVPAIALVKEEGYMHFVVIKGVRDGRVLLGDPALGTRVMSREKFETLWTNGILLVVTVRTQEAVFNNERDWRIRPVAPLQRVFDLTGLDTQLVRRGPMDY